MLSMLIENQEIPILQCQALRPVDGSSQRPGEHENHLYVIMPVYWKAGEAGVLSDVDQPSPLEEFFAVDDELIAGGIEVLLDGDIPSQDFPLLLCERFQRIHRIRQHLAFHAFRLSKPPLFCGTILA